MKKDAELHTFERIDETPIPLGVKEIRAVIVVFNERLRLPWLLTYYRALGVRRFFFIDNNSTDGTRQYLLQQPDCHVFLTHNSYKESGYGRVWQQAILDRFGEKNWWLVIDADEQFVYPACEKVPLHLLADYLDGACATAVSGFLLDMYSKEPVSEANYRAGEPFTDVCPYFDRDYSFWPRPQHRHLYKGTQHSIWQLRRGHAPLLFPAMEPIGGPRLRHFYPVYDNPGPFTVLKMKVMRHVGRIMSKLRIKLGESSLMPAVLFKVPFIKCGTGVRLIDSHSVSNAKFAPITGALLHFKFFSDFHLRVEDAVIRGEHFDGGSEYARYLRKLRDNPRLSFHYVRSVKYDNSRQLSDLGLIKDDESFANYRKSQSYDTALEAISNLLGEEKNTTEATTSGDLSG